MGASTWTGSGASRPRTGESTDPGDSWTHPVDIEPAQRDGELLARALEHRNTLVRIVARDLDAQAAICGGPHP
jgi:hypothetical protein